MLCKLFGHRWKVITSEVITLKSGIIHFDRELRCKRCKRKGFDTIIPYYEQTNLKIEGEY
jgi:hypothetical protein